MLACVATAPSSHNYRCGGILTEASPLSELLSVRDLDQGDLVLVAKSNDQLLVSLLLAGLVEDTHVCLATVEGLGGLAQTAGETIVHEGELQDSLEGVQNGHLALGGGIGRHLDLLGDFGGVVLFYVRLLRSSVSESILINGSVCSNALVVRDRVVVRSSPRAVRDRALQKSVQGRVNDASSL